VLRERIAAGQSVGGWRADRDPQSGYIFYRNVLSGERQWLKPSELNGPVSGLPAIDTTQAAPAHTAMKSPTVATTITPARTVITTNPASESGSAPAPSPDAVKNSGVGLEGAGARGDEDLQDPSVGEHSTPGITDGVGPAVREPLAAKSGTNLAAAMKRSSDASADEAEEQQREQKEAAAEAAVGAAVASARARDAVG